MKPYDLDRKYLPSYLPFSEEINYFIRIIYIRLKYLFTGFPPALALYKKRNIIFIHIPKNAGSSIVKSLYDDGISHSSALYYKTIDEEFFRKTESFALLRNPIDRFCSAFNYLKFHSKQEPNIKFRNSHLQDINNVSDLIIKMKFDPSFKSMILRFPHFRTQSEYVCNKKGEIIVNRIGHLDFLESFTNEISSYIHQPFNIEHINKSNNQKKISIIDVEFIENLYKLDLNLEYKVLENVDKILTTT